MFDISIYKAQNLETASDLENTTNKMKFPNSNLSLNEKSFNETKRMLNEAKNSQKTNIKNFEKDKKKYKVLKRYGEVLHLIEKLLGIIPTNLDNLSVEELTEKLEELMKSRKKNELQITFIFYQNLYTNSLNNLLTIEKDYHEGNISAREAFLSVKNIKKELKDHENNTPKILNSTKEEVDYLVTLYENSYSPELEEKKPNAFASKLENSKLKPSHELLIEQINSKTQETIKNIENLSSTLSSFEPQVDLSKLQDGLKSTEDILAKQDWNHDDLNSSISDLENTTNKLTSEQVEKNNQSENISNNIKDLTTNVAKISNTSIQEVSTETFKDAAQRAINAKNLVVEAENLTTENGTPTSNGVQIANAIISQMEADGQFCHKVSTDPNSANAFLEADKTEEAKDKAYEMKDNVLSLEEKQETVLNLIIKDNNDEDNEKNKKNS